MVLGLDLGLDQSQILVQVLGLVLALDLVLALALVLDLVLVQGIECEKNDRTLPIYKIYISGASNPHPRGFSLCAWHTNFLFQFRKTPAPQSSLSNAPGSQWFDRTKSSLYVCI